MPCNPLRRYVGFGIEAWCLVWFFRRDQIGKIFLCYAGLFAKGWPHKLDLSMPVRRLGVLARHWTLTLSDLAP